MSATKMRRPRTLRRRWEGMLVRRLKKGVVFMAVVLSVEFNSCHSVLKIQGLNMRCDRMEMASLRLRLLWYFGIWEYW